MTHQQAEQIAKLLNSRNQLSVEYSAERVLQHTDSYLFEISNDAVVACVEVKKVQWYLMGDLPPVREQEPSA